MLNPYYEYCAPFFALIYKFSRGEYADLDLKVKELFDQFTKSTRVMDLEHLNLIKYALCAFVDEHIINSDWSGKSAWLAKPLQVQHFAENLAGEEFFYKLDRMRRDYASYKYVIYIYLLCLNFGFKGHYRDSVAEDYYEFLHEFNCEYYDFTRIKNTAPEPADKKNSYWRVIISATLGIYIIFSSINYYRIHATEHRLKKVQHQLIKQ